MSEVSEADREKAIEAVVNALGGEALIDPLPSGIALDALIGIGWRPAGVPAVDREKLAGDVGYPASPDDVDEAQSMDYAEGYARGFNNAFENVLASGVLRSEADVKAEAWDAATGVIEERFFGGPTKDMILGWLGEARAAVLRGDGSAT